MRIRRNLSGRRDLDRRQSKVSDELKTRFQDGLATPIGEPGWRRLWLAETNERRLAGLYRKAGFVEQGEIPDMFHIDGASYGTTWMSRRV